MTVTTCDVFHSNGMDILEETFATLNEELAYLTLPVMIVNDEVYAGEEEVREALLEIRGEDDGR
ncbi:MAG: hypothetical protein ACOCW3_03795 [Spirochaetota bacterium]